MKLIFIPGSGNSSSSWYYQTEHFPDADAVSLPGHPEGKPCASVDEYADWMHQYILGWGYSEPVLVGHSLGGAIAQMYALKYPADVKGLVLIGSGARLRVKPQSLVSVEEGIDNPSAWLKDFVEPLHSRVTSGLKEAMIRKVVEVGARVQLSDLQCCDKFDIIDKVHQIEVPALVVCGSEDQMTPVKYSQYLVANIRDAELVIIEGGTHLVFMEKPGEVNQAIEKFLGGL